jgi:hypothetical protein
VLHGPSFPMITRRRMLAAKYLEGIVHHKSFLAAPIRRDTVLENCIFHISRMYEFSHSQGQNAKCYDPSCDVELLPDVLA